MFNATWFEKHTGEITTLRFHKDPRYQGLGSYTDVDGVRWDVAAIMGEFICARQESKHPNWYSTATFSTSSQGNDIVHRWIPYRVEIVGLKGQQEKGVLETV